jgi:hypothetical protein
MGSSNGLFFLTLGYSQHNGSIGVLVEARRR